MYKFCKLKTENKLLFEKFDNVLITSPIMRKELASNVVTLFKMIRLNVANPRISPDTAYYLLDLASK